MDRSAPIPVAVAVRTRLAVDRAGERFADSLEQRLTPLRQDAEAGSQVAEYALVAGVGAAACALVVTVLNGGLFKSFIEAVLGVLMDLVRSWF